MSEKEKQLVTISLSTEALLFKRRWEQECETSLLLTAEIRELRGQVSALQGVCEQQQKQLEKLTPSGEPVTKKAKGIN